MVYKRRTVEISLFYGAKPIIFERAREMRLNMTESEQKLWSVLRRKNIKGFRFRRQHPIGQFIADFYCHEAKLIIEVDGDIHKFKQQEYDQGRTYELGNWGLKVVRFTNQQVMSDLDKVIQHIKENLSRT